MYQKNVRKKTIMKEPELQPEPRRAQEKRNEQMSK